MMSFPHGSNRSAFGCPAILCAALVVAGLVASASATPVTVDLQYTAVAYAKAVAATDYHFVGPGPMTLPHTLSDFDANVINTTNSPAAVAVHARVEAYEGWMLVPSEYGEDVWVPNPVVIYAMDMDLNASVAKTVTGILFSSAQSSAGITGSHSIVDLDPNLIPPYDSPEYDQYRSSWWACAAGTVELGIDEVGGYPEGTAVPLDLTTSFSGEGDKWDWFVTIKRSDEVIAELKPGASSLTIDALAGETLTFEMANIPEPASVSLLLLGGLAVVLRRRK